jgi:hypothetical protein
MKDEAGRPFIIVREYVQHRDWPWEDGTKSRN